MPPNVAAAFAAFPPAVATQLHAVRALLFETAARLPEVGPLTETLKWGEPAYLTEATKTGSTVRLGLHRLSGKAAVLLNCRTTLVDSARERFPQSFGYDGTRAILLGEPLGEAADDLATCLAMALTYHQRHRSVETPCA